MAGCGCHNGSCAKYMYASKNKTMATMKSASSLEMAAQRVKHHFNSIKAAKRAIATKKKNPERVIPRDFTKDGYVKKSSGGRGKKY